MARGINKVILVGYLGAEPDMRRSNQDTPICNISLATTEGWRDMNGQVQTRTEWRRCVCFKRLAAVAAQFLHKGSLVYVEGRLSTRKWVDQQKVTHYTTELIGTEMQMLSSTRPQGGGEFSGAASGDDYSQQGGDDYGAPQGGYGQAPAQRPQQRSYGGQQRPYGSSQYGSRSYGGQQGGYGQPSGQSGYSSRPQGGYSPYTAPASGAPKAAPEPAPMAGSAPSAAKPQAPKVSEPMPKEPAMADDLDNIDNEDVPF